MTHQYNPDWPDAAQQYQSTVGAVSAQTATELVSMATALTTLTSDCRLLDAGCGPRAVILALIAKAPDTFIDAIDTSQKMLAHLATNIEKSAATPSNLTYKYGPPYRDTKLCYMCQGIISRLETRKRFAIATPTPHSDPYIIWDHVCRIYDTEYVQASYAVDPLAWASPGQIAGGLQITGFVQIKSVLRRVPFPTHTAEEWADFWLGGENPAAEAVTKPFLKTHDMSVAEVKDTLKRVVTDEWEGGKNVMIEMVLAIGTRP